MKQPGMLLTCWPAASPVGERPRDIGPGRDCSEHTLAGGHKPRRGEAPLAQVLTASALPGDNIHSCRLSLHPSFAATAVQAFPGFSPSQNFFHSPPLLMKYPEPALHILLGFSPLFSFALKDKSKPKKPKTKPFSFFHSKWKTKINKAATTFPPPSSNPPGSLKVECPF